MRFEFDPPTPRGGDTSSVLTRLNLIMTIIHHTSLRLTSCRSTRTNVNANSKDEIMETLRITCGMVSLVGHVCFDSRS